MNDQNVDFDFAQQCGTVSTLDDSIVENSGSFTLQLVSAGDLNDRITIAPSLAVITVVDNDCKFIDVIV